MWPKKCGSSIKTPGLSWTTLKCLGTHKQRPIFRAVMDENKFAVDIGLSLLFFFTHYFKKGKLYTSLFLSTICLSKCCYVSMTVEPRKELSRKSSPARDSSQAQEISLPCSWDEALVFRGSHMKGNRVSGEDWNLDIDMYLKEDRKRTDLLLKLCRVRGTDYPKGWSCLW